MFDINLSYNLLVKPKNFFLIEESDSPLNSDAEDEEAPGPSNLRKRTASGSLIGEINPLAFFSNADAKSMKDEVDELLSCDDDDDKPDNRG